MQYIATLFAAQLITEYSKTRQTAVFAPVADWLGGIGRSPRAWRAGNDGDAVVRGW